MHGTKRFTVSNTWDVRGTSQEALPFHPRLTRKPAYARGNARLIEETNAIAVRQREIGGFSLLWCRILPVLLKRKLKNILKNKAKLDFASVRMANSIAPLRSPFFLLLAVVAFSSTCAAFTATPALSALRQHAAQAQLGSVISEPFPVRRQGSVSSGSPPSVAHTPHPMVWYFGLWGLASTRTCCRVLT